MGKDNLWPFTPKHQSGPICNREGRRVFYLAPGDHLTPGARDFLRSNHIEILSPEAAKPQVYKTLQGGQSFGKSRSI